MRRMILLLLVASLLDASPCPGAEQPGTAEQPGRLFDGFDGRLALDWQQIRPDAGSQSLEKNPGRLTITTQYGSIHLTGRPVLAKNLFLLDISNRTESDFAVTTCLEGFRPLAGWNQAGLVIYDDDDNYLKFVSEFRAVGQAHLNALAETDGQSKITQFQVPLSPTRLWLRVVKRGDRYETSSSNDGEHFDSYADISWGNGKPKFAGILAKNGNMPNARNAEASFDFFELRDLTSGEKGDPSPDERARLLGTWKLAAAHLEGKAMANPALTGVTIAANLLTFSEKSRKLVGSYTIDSASTPKKLVFYAQSGTALTPLNFAYALDEGKLTLCTTPKAGAEMPDALKTEKGDGRMLLTLARVDTQE